MTDILDDSYESDLTDEEHERMILMSEHAIAPPLSPAAQAVLNAYRDADIDDEATAAAVLRAVADQLGESPAPGVEFEDLYPRIIEVPDLLAIADELEAQ